MSAKEVLTDKAAQLTAQVRQGTKQVKKVRWYNTVLGIGTAWLMIAALLQQGLGGMFFVYVLVTLIVAAFGFFAAIKAQQLQISFFAFAALLIVWLGFAKSYSYSRDIIAIVAGIVIAALVAGLLKLTFGRRAGAAEPEPQALGFAAKIGGGVRIAEHRPATDIKFGLLMVPICWLAMSVADLYGEVRTVPTDPERFEEIGSPDDPSRIGLALSGGGYRAAVFHAGVLHALEQMDVRVTHMSTVSGGSIIGSFYQQGGAPCDFLDATVAGRFNLKRDLFNVHNALRLPFPGRVPVVNVDLLPVFSFSRADVQANLLDRVLLGGAPLTDHATDRSPKLMVNATDLHRGFLVGITSRGVLLSGPSTRRFLGLDQLPQEFRERNLADAAAISGAFPGAFPPSLVKLDLLGGETEALTVALADGGILDNTGVLGLIQAHRESSAGAAPATLEELPGKRKVWNLQMQAQSLPMGESASMVDDWSLDLVLASDGGAFLQSADELHDLAALSRAIDLASGNPFANDHEEDGLQVVDIDPEAFRPDLDEVIDFATANLAADRMNLRFHDDNKFWRAVAGSLTEEFKNQPNEETMAGVDFCTRPSSQWSPVMADGAARDTLRTELIKDLTKAVELFEETPTLQDQFEADHARALFRLGFYTAYNSAPEIATRVAEVRRAHGLRRLALRD